MGIGCVKWQTTKGGRASLEQTMTDLGAALSAAKDKVKASMRAGKEDFLDLKLSGR